MTIEILKDNILTIVDEYPIRKLLFLGQEQQVQIKRIVMWI